MSDFSCSTTGKLQENKTYEEIYTYCATKKMTDNQGYSDENLSITDIPSWLQGISDGNERSNRRKSLECSSIGISIDDTELSDFKAGEQPYTLFIIKVSPGIKSWYIKRRYSDFLFLHTSLSKYIHSEILPKLPAKRYFRSSIETQFVEERRLQLQNYLSAVVLIPSAWKRSELPRFLDNESNSMIFLWNFEKMRKMHEALSTMTIENKTETAKLTNELNIAQQQVTYLQERISRMEMLFLQHASGMAVTNFSPKLIRSISCDETNKNITSEHYRSYSNNTQILSSNNNGVNISAAHSPSSKSHLSSETSDSIDTLSEKEDFIINKAESELETAFLKLTSSSDKIDLENLKIVMDLASSNRLLSADILTENGDRFNSKSVQDVKNVALSIKLQECIRLSDQILDNSVYDSIETAVEIENYPIDTVSLDNDFHLSDYIADQVSSYKSSDAIVNALMPTVESIESRMRIFHYVRGIIGTLHGAICFPVGSFTSNTFLPNGDIDITLFLHYSNENDSWFAKINEALCYSTFNQSNGNDQYNRVVVQSVNFVNADVKLVKARINNINVDISNGQIGALYSQALIEKLDSYIGKNHLLKRSIILIKAWSHYESGRYADGSILGAIDGRFSTWSLIVTILFIYNKYGAIIEHPFNALGFWLEYLSTFDWTNHAFTINGPLSVTDLSSPIDTQKHGYFPVEIIEELQIRCESTRIAACTAAESRNLDPSYLRSTYVFGDTTNFYKRGYFNIMDPISTKINTSRSVSVDGARAISKMLKAGFNDYVTMIKNCDLSNLGDEAVTKHIFSNAIFNIQQQRSLVVRYSADLPIELDLLENQLDQIEVSIQHAELVLGLILHEGPLLKICARLLIENNTMPIGEIGKLLSSLFNTDVIIKKIKESYGGLKKFIELPNLTQNKVKIALLSDHPFNPTAQIIFTEEPIESIYNRSNKPYKFDHDHDYFYNTRTNNKDMSSKVGHGNHKGSRSKKLTDSPSGQGHHQAPVSSPIMPMKLMQKNINYNNSPSNKLTIPISDRPTAISFTDYMNVDKK